MSIYRLEAKVISRKGKDAAGHPNGQQVSSVCKAAYRSGQRLFDERADQVFDYGPRNHEVVYREILAPETAPAWLSGPESREKREALWNAVEASEKRSDSQLCREFIISLPVELDRQQQINAIRGWCEEQLISKGFVADIAIHKGEDGHNPHTHILATLRPVDASGFGKKPRPEGLWNKPGAPGFDAKGELHDYRESWEIHCNKALEAAGEAARVDHRSLADQGIDRLPEPKIGVTAIHMQREGKIHDPYMVRANRRARMWNTVLSAVRDVESKGEVAQRGVGWWDRATQLGNQFYGRSAEFLQDESSGGRPWQNFVQKRREPDLGQSPELG